MTPLADLARRLSGGRIAIVGDVMLDHFLFGQVDRISPEAPVPIVHFDHEEYRLGGAANVACNVAALGGRPALVGVVGRDETAAVLRRELHRAGIPDSGLVEDGTRVTTRKTRVVTARNQQVARIDYEQTDDLPPPALAALLDRLSDAVRPAQAVVLSDYQKGVVGSRVIAAAAAAAAAAHVPLLVDPKVPRIERYRGATLLTPNHHEAELMTHTAIRTPDGARQAARQIHEQSGASVLVTWGERGMWMLDAAPAAPVEAHLPAAAREVADVTGAGDTVIAVLALGLAIGAPLADAARLANLAAGLVVARFGPATISSDELAGAAGPEG
jgi:rfaE bifunctional protein kinase chain/domain